MKAQVAIIGAGPAGMFLALMLQAVGIKAVVLERRDRAHAESRVRAGVLEQTTVDLMHRLAVSPRLKRDGLVHDGFNIAYDAGMFRIDLHTLTEGSSVTVYGQQEVMRDLFEAAEARGAPIIFDAEDVALNDISSAEPFVTYRHNGQISRLDCDFIAGCDGFYGVSRASIPASIRKTFERAYPFGWLGILTDTPPAAHELIYCNHERGFALASMRSPTRSRYYIQCALDEDLAEWSDERFWDELCLRLDGSGVAVPRGPSFEKGIAPLRSFVSEPMRYGRLFLAGDAAHIVPPTGAKGMNLATSDVIMLAEALEGFYAYGDDAGLEAYSGRALDRVWKAERFSWWFTGLMHRFPHTDPFDRRMQIAEIEYLRGSRRAQAVMAENYVGLPLGGARGARWRA